VKHGSELDIERSPDVRYGHSPADTSLLRPKVSPFPFAFRADVRSPLLLSVFLLVLLFLSGILLITPEKAIALSPLKGKISGWSFFSTAGQDTSRFQTGAQSRRARALLRKRATSTVVDQPRSAESLLDSIRALPRDSSARLAHFHHLRVDLPMVQPFVTRTHPLYLIDPPLVRTQHFLDSSKFVYRVRRLVGTIDVKVPLEYSLEEYVQLRFQQAIRQNWEALATKYELEAERKRGLGELFGSVTNIEIPVPKNPLFSIFGPNIIRLQINGAVDIHAAFRNTASDLFVANPLGQSRNEPDFSQNVQVNVKGEIGDKLKIDADWNTQRTFEFENQLRVRYTGYEDDVVQSVEAGNVSLQTNSTFISGNQALFGIKTGFQFGPLKLTTIASQKKGQVRELTVSGGGRPTPFVKRATDYSRDHYFIDTSYIVWFDSTYLNIPAKVNTAKQIKEIEVWVTRIGNEDPNERDVVAFMDGNRVVNLQDNRAARLQDYNNVPGEVEVGRFVRLELGTDYTFHEYAGYITLNRSLQPEQAIAVAYSIPHPTDPRRSFNIGNFGTKDTAKTLKLIMKLVRPQRLGPQFKTAWRMMLKNIYPLGGRGIKKDGFELKMLYEVSGREPQDNVLGFNLIEMFGLDRFGEQPGTPPDGKFDYAPNITINESRGELIFPRVEPFREGIRRYFEGKGRSIAEADSFIFAEVYDTTFNGASNSPRNKFLIQGTITSSIASTYSIGFNVVEGSVEVIANGQRAQLGSDYTVDYISGQVVIRNQALLVPGTNLQIKYEANDLFQLASKSLLGARGEFNLGKNSGFGFTIMNLNQQTLSDKVRLGEEPINNTIFGIDGGTAFEMDFLTRALNYLPGVQTNTPSSLSLRGEAAYMLPDPNTRKSPIPQDGGSGIAYIDDFEGARRTIPLPVAYTNWFPASIPEFIPDLDTPFKQTLQEKQEYRAKLDWYNILPSDVLITDLKPERERLGIVPGENQLTVLNLWFRPNLRAPFNYSMDFKNKLFAHPRRAWNGIMRLISSTASNLLDENINFIEFWVNIQKSQPTVKLHIDLGIISEEVIPNNKLDTEDGLDGGIRNGILGPDEDRGLDGLTDAQERVEFAEFIRKYPQYSNDPSGDNWVRPVASSLLPKDYENINGTENNSQSEAGRFPDTEDLNRNNVLDRANSYFTYEIPLDTTNPIFVKYRSGGGAAGWYQIRIPIIDTTRSVGTPSFTNVDAIRLWLSGADQEVLIRLAEMNLVGNQWEELVKNDSTFKVSVVNREDNPNYESPVPPARDRTRPDREIYLNEQSLNLVIEGLRDGETRQAIKRYPVRPLDLFSYKTMKMFVHGDKGDKNIANRMQYVDLNNYDLELFFRFGSDSLNYYEYRAPIRPGWDPANEIVIRFSELTAIKLGRDSVGVISARVPVPNGPDGATYQVRGEPTLTNVRLLVIGVENPYNKGKSVVSGEVWVNELRLTDVDDTPGWAYRFDSQVKFADIASVSVNMTQRDPFFHSLEERFGSRMDDRTWSLNANFAFEKLLPTSWAGSSLTFNYSRVEQILNPKYLPGTDILVDEAVERTRQALSERENVRADDADSMRVQSQTLSISETFSLPNIRVNLPVDHWLVSETINRISLAWSFNRTVRRSPTVESFNQWQWNARIGYGLQFSERSYLEPLAPLGDFFLFSPWKGLKVFYLPRSINVSTTLTRGQTNEQARNQTTPKPVVRNFVAARSMSFNWQLTDGGFLNLGTDYSLDVQSSLLSLETDQFGNPRSFPAIVGEMFGKSRLIDFGDDLQYGQTITINPRPVIPPILKLDKILSLSTRYSSRYDWTNNLQAGALGKTAAATANLTLNLDVNVKTLGREIWSDAPQSVPIEPDTMKRGVSPLDMLDRITRIVIKTPIFDFDKVTISFTQQNRSQNSGVVGRPGFSNVFGRVPFFQSSLPEYGPSLFYQLGMASDPHGDVTIKTKGSFPFITGFTTPGLRAPLGNLADVFAQSNRLSMRTSRPLWEGASIEFNWNVGWSYTVNRTLTTDSLGIPFETNKVVSGDVDRSYLTFPPILFFKFFRTSIEDVQKSYERMRVDPNDPRTPDAKLADAFENGLEAFPLFKNLLGDILPRPNWTIRWEGLEKFPVFNIFAARASFDHSYTSGYKRRWRISPTGEEVTENQQVTYGFSPLIGLNLQFKDFIKGNFGATFRYGITTSYDLQPAAQNIQENDVTDITISANYSRQGFEIPFFGLSLSNDLDISFSYGYSRNSRRLYDMKEVNFRKEGTPMEGSSRTILEPRIRYILSSRVTASIYYKYSKTKPDAGGSKIPGQTINEGGLDVRVAIQP